MKRPLILSGAFLLTMLVMIPAVLAQEVTGGCSATVNGRTLDTLDIKHPLVVAKGDTVALTGQVPNAAGGGNVSSETRIFVEVVGDVPVATEPGDGPFWGGTVEVPDVLTSLAPGVYKVKGTAEGSGWLCTGSAYIKIEGGPVTAAAAIGVVAAGAGTAAAIGASRSKETQVFHQAGETAAPRPDTGARYTTDVVTFGLFILLAFLVGFVGPSWVVF